MNAPLLFFVVGGVVSIVTGLVVRLTLTKPLETIHGLVNARMSEAQAQITKAEEKIAALEATVLSLQTKGQRRKP
jgi:hypothetical protein